MKKLLFLFLGLAVSGPAADYTMQAAMEAAGKVLPKDAPPEFVTYNLPSAGEKKHAKQLLEVLRAARGSKRYFAIITAKDEFARDLLAQALKLAKKNEKFTDPHLIISGDRIEPALFADVLKDRGIDVHYAAWQ